MPGRAQWLILQWGGLTCGFLNLYALNHESACAGFWSQIANALPSVDEWCIVGDFNMIEASEDRRGGGPVTNHGLEFAA